MMTLEKLDRVWSQREVCKYKGPSGDQTLREYVTALLESAPFKCLVQSIDPELAALVVERPSLSELIINNMLTAFYAGTEAGYQVGLAERLEDLVR
jgi:hypothetical protein